MPTIPASESVNITPSVITPGGAGVGLNGMFLTNSARLPVGAVMSFASASNVLAYFGSGSSEYSVAQTYFAGYDNSQVKPTLIWFASYQTAAVGAWLRGGSLSSMTLTQLQALPSGTIIITVNGSPVTSASINLSGATSFSNAAALITTGLASANAICTYDSISGGFLISNASTGTTSTYSFASGTLAASLNLTAATGATISQGAVASVPATLMAAILTQTTNFVSFTTIPLPSKTDMVAFATWNGLQVNRYAYICWDNDLNATTNNDTTSALYLINQAGIGGTCYNYDPTNGLNLAAFVMGAIGSINFNATNGRATLCYRSQSGLVPGITNQTLLANLEANGGNAYVSEAAAATGFTFYKPGAITGSYRWVDSYVGQIWMNSQFQMALIALLQNVRSIPYNSVGYAMIDQALASPIAQAVNAGVVRAGTTLSGSEIAAVNSGAGLAIDRVLFQRGWYLQVLDPGATVRGTRGTPVINFWYCDGQSVQTINMNSVELI